MATKSTITKMTAKKGTGKQNTCSSCLSIKLDKLVKNTCVTCIEQKKAKKNEASRQWRLKLTPEQKAKKNETARQYYLKRTPEQNAKYNETSRRNKALKKQQSRIENVEITVIVSAVAATRPIPPPRDRSKLIVFTAAAPAETAIVTRPTPPPRDRSKLSVHSTYVEEDF